MSGVTYLASQVGLVAACGILAVARASYYRLLAPPVSTSRPSPPRALSAAERQRVLDALHEPRFVDLAPAEVYATMLPDSCGQQRGARPARPESSPKPSASGAALHEAQRALELDITKLEGPAKWTYFYLYVVLDVFSRYAVGWMILPRESAGLAKQLITETCRRERIEPLQLTLHADRGSAMTSHSFAFVLADLGVTKTHSRPHVSNDNPFSEAAFKTLKYRPGVSDRFGSDQDARAHCGRFFNWYNAEHRHGALGLCTPYEVHLDAAFRANPERFPHGRPLPRSPPTAGWINKPESEVSTEEAAQ
jgi:putative transposase